MTPEPTIREIINAAVGLYLDLTGADLIRANLTGADLSNANLAWADLTGADLTGANLSGARLFEAILPNAKLRGADLRDAGNLTQRQLDVACGDENTKLPQGLTIKACPKPQR